MSKNNISGVQYRTIKTIPNHNNDLKQYHLAPGAVIWVDQYQIKITGRLTNTYGQEKKDNRHNGGTIYVDYVTILILIYNQASLHTGESLVGNKMFVRFPEIMALLLSKLI